MKTARVQFLVAATLAFLWCFICFFVQDDTKNGVIFCILGTLATAGMNIVEHFIDE